MKKKGQCHYAYCNRRATYGFISKNKILQSDKYCRNHALSLNRNKVFPECAVISLSNYKLLMSGKGKS